MGGPVESSGNDMMEWLGYSKFKDYLYDLERLEKSIFEKGERYGQC